MERRLTAILAADVVGYSRLMGEDEVGTLARLKSCRRELVDPAIEEFHGRIIKLMGDGALVEFASVVDAVQCAAAIQRRMADRDQGTAEARQIRFRIGVNLGDIIVEGDDIYGDGVNIAARLEAMAEPGGICISGTAFDHAVHKVDVGFAGPRRAAPQEYRRSGSRLSGSARSRRSGEDRGRATPAGLPDHDFGRNRGSPARSPWLAGIFALAKALRARNDHPLRCCHLPT